MIQIFKYSFTPLIFSNQKSKTRDGNYKGLVTIEELRGFLLANTTQQPESNTCFSTPTVSELAEQSTNVKPVAIKRSNEILMKKLRDTTVSSSYWNNK